MVQLSVRRLRHGAMAAAVALACLLAGPCVWAEEPLELQNRRDTPASPTPASPGTPTSPTSPGTVIVPSPQAPQVIVPVEPVRPQVVTPEVDAPQAVTPPLVVVPAAPEQPAQPETRPTQVPERPETPQVTPPGTVVIVPQLPEAKAPEGEKKATVPLTPENFLLIKPESERKPLTPENFLLITPEPERKPAPQPEEKPAQVEKKPAPPRPEIPKEPSPEPKEKKPEKAETPKKGDPLRIPEEAKKTGQLDFLEGCWVGTRPEYHTKRIITERFCFGKDGIGKRFIEDPAHAGQCVGATRALLNQGGVLRMQSEKMYCTNTPENWGGSEMTCQGEGEQTPCTWVFTDVGGARQSYSIRFVRE